MNSTPCFVNAVPLTKTAQLGVQVQPAKLTRTTLAHTQSRAIIQATAAGSTQRLVWTDALPLSELQPGDLKARVMAGLDVCIACDENGEVYALGNKGPPLGIPLSDGEIMNEGGVSYVRDPQYGTCFELRTGQVQVGSWLSSPPLISFVLRKIFGSPEGVVTFQVRDNGEMLQVLLDSNARADYEKNYWKGLLDATGKADGGYY